MATKKTASTLDGLDAEELRSLSDWIGPNPRGWQSRLQSAWLAGRTDRVLGDLYALRNRLGPEWLFGLPSDSREVRAMIREALAGLDASDDAPGSVGVVVGLDDAAELIRQHNDGMTSPNVWHVSDHGNASLYGRDLPAFDWAGPCSECESHGYFTSRVDREPFVEVERCDSCARLADDDAAAVAFVRDMERDAEWAHRCARELGYRREGGAS